MGDIHQFPPSPPQQEPPPNRPMYVEVDQCTLQCICRWRYGRAMLAAAIAKSDGTTLFGSIDVDEPPFDHSGRELRDQMEPHLANAVPYSARAARELLDCAMDMLLAQEKDDQSFSADGPVFDIVKNVHKALSHMDGDTRLNLYCREMKECDAIDAKQEAADVLPPTTGGAA